MTKARDNANADGLDLITSATIGNAVSSIVVSNVFSSTYDNYKIMVGGGVGSTTLELSFIFTGNTSGYYSGGVVRPYVNTSYYGTNVNNGSAWTSVGSAATGAISLNMDIFNPFLTKISFYNAIHSIPFADSSTVYNGGWHNSSTSFSGFTITTTTGTLTGGTISIYGYRK